MYILCLFLYQMHPNHHQIFWIAELWSSNFLKMIQECLQILLLPNLWPNLQLLGTLMCWVKIILHRIISVVCFTNFPSEIRSLHQPTMMRLNFTSRAWDGVNPVAFLWLGHSPMIASSRLWAGNMRIWSSLSGLLNASIEMQHFKTLS